MKKLFQFILLLSFTSFSQIKYYKINYGNLPQSIELIENDNSKFKGSINTVIKKGSWHISWLTRTWRNLWEIEPKEITIVNPLDEELVKNLMFQLEKDGIETIKNCKDDIDCNNIGFLDGSSTSFKIKTGKIDRDYYFDEIYPISKDNIESNEIRKQAQNMITTLDKYINQKENFSNVIKQLPSGKYYYFSGISICQINHSKKKKKHITKKNIF
jgi:hypothetical protein